MRIREEAKELGTSGFKFSYMRNTRFSNRIGIIAGRNTQTKEIVHVKRVGDRIIALQIIVEQEIFNVVSVYAPQVGIGEKYKVMSLLYMCPKPPQTRFYHFFYNGSYSNILSQSSFTAVPYISILFQFMLLIVSTPLEHVYVDVLELKILATQVVNYVVIQCTLLMFK